MSKARTQFGYEASTPEEIVDWQRNQAKHVDLSDNAGEYMMVVSVVHTATMHWCICPCLFITCGNAEASLPIWILSGWVS